MIKGREAKPAPSADLLVCFPSRAHHLTLMPKPICSPARPTEPNKRHHHHHHHHLKKSSFGGGQASPMLWTKTKSMGSEIAEPTSPKVTCAGQIKVRPKAGACRSWQSVMEEIEKIHNHRKQRKQKKPTKWPDSLGFKKEVMHFLACLRGIKFDLRCFGSFPETDAATTDDEDDEDDEENNQNNNEGSTSRTVFSKWFMVLQENQNNGFPRQSVPVPVSESNVIPPPNALLLMRCRSAPAKSWLKQNKEKEEENGEEKKTELKKGRSLRSLMEEEENRKKENLVVNVMKCDSDFYEISSDIAKETWIVGGLSDPLSRSRSWKR